MSGWVSLSVSCPFSSASSRTPCRLPGPPQLGNRWKVAEKYSLPRIQCVCNAPPRLHTPPAAALPPPRHPPLVSQSASASKRSAACAALDHRAEGAPSTAAATAASRREWIVGSAALAGGSLAPAAVVLAREEDANVTQKVFFDIGVCFEELDGTERLLGSSDFCKQVQPKGRIVIGLYGDLVPKTVDNFVQLVTGPYKGTVINQVVQGQYISAGRQGPRRLGLLDDVKVPSNPDVLSMKAFRLSPEKPGAVSLLLESDFVEIKAKSRSEFAIATGPAPAVSLDGRSIVFGRVIEGFDLVSELSQSLTFLPAQRIQAFNKLAGLVGDDRAKKARNNWNRPKQALLITDCGLVDE